MCPSSGLCITCDIQKFVAILFMTFANLDLDYQSNLRDINNSSAETLVSSLCRCGNTVKETSRLEAAESYLVGK